MAAPTPSHVLNWGMVALYLKSFPAARNATTELVNLHAPCLDAGLGDPRLAMLKRCKVCLKEVPENEIVKGYASAKGSYVRFTPEEIENLAADKSKTMTLRGFVKFTDVDPLRLGLANFLGPIDGAAMRPFMLLLEAMRDNNLAALVTYFGHGRDKVGIIRAGEETLVLHDAFFSTEIRTYASQAKVQLVKAEFSPEEKKLATALVQQAVIPFSTIDEMRDGFMDRVTEQIKAREEGLEMPVYNKPVAPVQTLDLVAALKASLAATPATAPAPAPSKPPVKVEAKAPEKIEKKKARKSA